MSHVPPATTPGAKFLPEEFICQPKPVPPDRDHRKAKDSSKYSERQDTRGDDCAGKLESVGGQLDARGLVAH